MNRGSTATCMIWKQGPVIPVEVTWFSMTQRRRGKVTARSWPCLLCFFNWEGVEYAPPGQAINKKYYLNVLHRLRDAIWQKWPQLWATADWQLHQGKVPAHASHLMQKFLAKHQITQVTEHSLQPRFGTLQLLAFPKTKISFEREDISDQIQENMTGLLMVIPTRNFVQCIE